MIRRALLALAHGWLAGPAELNRQTTRAERAEAELARVRRALGAQSFRAGIDAALTTPDIAPIETP